MSKKKKKIIITVDGYSSCGKSTFAKAIATELGYIYIDSGAMYRAVTLFALRRGLVKDGVADEEQILAAMPEISITFRPDSATGFPATYLNGEKVEMEIRDREVSDSVSPVSTIAGVRARLVELQRAMGAGGGVVMDGRDIGTVVFPDAELKIFMTASPEVRAQRRYLELVSKGLPADREAVVKNITDRDRIDSSREASPLRRADDALILDNSEMTPAEQMEWFRKIFNSRVNES
ncbi:MAG: (d)CMP kinase [Bacteroidales bacterium]